MTDPALLSVPCPLCKAAVNVACRSIFDDSFVDPHEDRRRLFVRSVKLTAGGATLFGTVPCSATFKGDHDERCTLPIGHTGIHVGPRHGWTAEEATPNAASQEYNKRKMADEERQEYIRRHQKLLDEYFELERAASKLFSFVCGLSENLMTKPQIEERMCLKRELGILLKSV